MGVIDIKYESGKHKELKKFAEEIFEKRGFDVEREEKAKEISVNGRHPDLILDGEIPVEVGTVQKEDKKIQDYLQAVGEFYWIPYPDELSTELNILHFEGNMEDIKIEELRDERNRLKERVEELEKKNKELHCFKGFVIRILESMPDKINEKIGKGYLKQINETCDVDIDESNYLSYVQPEWDKEFR